MVAHTLRAQQGSEDGTGRGTPIIPTAHAFDARQSDVVQYGDLTGLIDTDRQSVGVMQPVAIAGNLIGRTEGGPSGIGVSDVGVMFTLTKTDIHGVLLGGIDYQHNGHTAEEPTGPLLKGSPTGGGSPLPAVAFTQNTRDEVRYINGDGQIVGALAADAGVKQTNYLAVPAMAFEPGSIARRAGPAGEQAMAPTLRSGMGDNQPAVRVGMAVRRLTPRECERLQGFPDDYTLISYRNKPAADGPRYKALGNSMAVPVMRWIGQRLHAVHAISPTPDEEYHAR